jgi:hypothetical protein
MTAAALKPRPLTCQRCGTAFECGSAVGKCWCADEDFKLPMPPAGSAEDCLCPDCLRAYALSLKQHKETAGP